MSDMLYELFGDSMPLENGYHIDTIPEAPPPPPPTNPDQAFAAWVADVQRLCIEEAGGNVALGLSAASYIVATKAPESVALSLHASTTVTINGKQYQPGQFIPEEEMSKATDAEVHEISGQAYVLGQRAIKSGDKKLHSEAEQAHKLAAEVRKSAAKTAKGKSKEEHKKFIGRHEASAKKHQAVVTDAFFAYDIKQRKGQGILNRARERAKDFAASASRALAAALKRGDTLSFMEKYQNKLSKLLADVYLESTMEGVKKVAAKAKMAEKDLVQMSELKAASVAKAAASAAASAQETMEKIHEAVANEQEVVEAGTFLSVPYLEAVLRASIQSSFSDGQMFALKHPTVLAKFPYAEYNAHHDDVVRDNHLELEKLGIDGTNVYRSNDPVFQLFRPPWDYGDRCGWNPLTIAQAAEAGVSEAEEWLRTGTEPTPPAFVSMPLFSPPDGFERTLPLSIQFSLQPMFLGIEEEKRDDHGRWTGNKIHLPKGLLKKPGMRTRVKHMVHVAKTKLNAFLQKSGHLVLKYNLLPDAYDHARNALLNTAVPGVPLNDVAVGLSKVLAWAFKKLRRKSVVMSVNDERSAALLELTGILYEMLGLDPPITKPEEETDTLLLEPPVGSDAAIDPAPKATRLSRRTSKRKPRKWKMLAIAMALPTNFTGKAPPDKLGRVYHYKEGKRIAGGDRLEHGQQVKYKGEAGYKIVGHHDTGYHLEHTETREKRKVADSSVEAHGGKAEPKKEPKAKKRHKAGSTVLYKGLKGFEVVRDHPNGVDYIVEHVETGVSKPVAAGSLEPDTESENVRKTKRLDEEKAIARITDRLERYKALFEKRGNTEAAEWMDLLSEHISVLGPEEALETLGEAKTNTKGKVQYEGAYDELGESEEETEFIKKYLDKAGISLVYQDSTVKPDSPLVSSFSKKNLEQLKRNREQRTGDYIPSDQTYANKLEETKALPGLETTEDVHKVFGSKVTHFTPEVMAKFDEVYGKGQWIVKSYGTEAYAGFGVFFPQRIKQINRDAKSVILDSKGYLEDRGFSILREDGTAVGIKKDGIKYKFGSKEFDNLKPNIVETAKRIQQAAPSEKATRLPTSPEDAIQNDYGVTLRRNKKGVPIGITDWTGIDYDFGSDGYDINVLDVDGGAKDHAIHRAVEADEWRREGFSTEPKFMVGPAFQAVGVSAYDRAMGNTWETASEGRVHAVTRDGKASAVPYATLIGRGDDLPAVFPSEESRAMERVVEEAINKLPESERSGQMYAPDVVKTKNGWKVLELNPSAEGGGSDWLGRNPFVIDAVVSHIVGREPMHVQFIRKLLQGKKVKLPEALVQPALAIEQPREPAGTEKGGRFAKKGTLGGMQVIRHGNIAAMYTTHSNKRIKGPKLGLKNYKQQDYHSCGFVAALTVTRYLVPGTTAKEVLKAVRPTKSGGVDAEGLTEALETLGVSAEYTNKLSIKKLRKHVENGTPVLITVYPEDWSSDHWTVVQGFDDDRVYLTNYKSLSIKQFKKEWYDVGEGLVCSKQDAALTIDKSGHSHLGKGKGGGQFTKKVETGTLAYAFSPKTPVYTDYTVAMEEADKVKLSKDEKETLEVWQFACADMQEYIREGKSNPFYATFYNVLEKLPVYEGPLYKGLHHDEKEIVFKEGDVFTDKAPTSFTGDVNTGLKYAQRQVLCYIKKIPNARHLPKSTFLPEVLVEGGLTYRVVKIEHNKTLEGTTEKSWGPTVQMYIELEIVPNRPLNAALALPANFTGKAPPDKLGRVYHYKDGKRIAGGDRLEHGQNVKYKGEAGYKIVGHHDTGYHLEHTETREKRKVADSSVEAHGGKAEAPKPETPAERHAVGQPVKYKGEAGYRVVGHHKNGKDYHIEHIESSTKKPVSASSIEAHGKKAESKEPEHKEEPKTSGERMPVGSEVLYKGREGFKIVGHHKNGKDYIVEHTETGVKKPVAASSLKGTKNAGKPAEPSKQVEGKAERPKPTTPSKTGSGEDKSADREAPRRIPVTVDEAKRRIGRYEKLFRDGGHNIEADWISQLRNHIESVGTDAALASLGEEVAGEGENVQYAGQDMEGKGDAAFVEAYLNRNGISFVTGQRPEGNERAISTVAPSSDEFGTKARGAERDVFPTLQTLKDKLDETQHLPGLESTEDLSKLMGGELGAKVPNFTPEVLKKLDEKYGEGKWIVKSYGDEAYAGYGIFFPQRVAKLQEEAKKAIWDSGAGLSQYGFSHTRDANGIITGIKHSSGDEYLFDSDKYRNTIQGDARKFGDMAADAAASEKSLAISEGKFMASPAFPVVGISNEERAQGITFKRGGEGRTHITTKNGKAELIPHSTWLKMEPVPVVFEDDDTRAMAKAAVDAINALPESERQGQLYAPDIVRTAAGYKVVEANPANEAGASGYLQDNPFIIDSYVSHITGREPAHVKFIRKLLSKKAKALAIALGFEESKVKRAPKGAKGGGRFTKKEADYSYKGLPLDFPGWNLIGQFESDVGSFVLSNGKEAALLEVPEGLTVADVKKATEGLKLKYITASHEHWDHIDQDVWKQLQEAFPEAEVIHPSEVMGHKLLDLEGEQLWLLEAPKHSPVDIVTVFRGTAMTGDIELGTLDSVNKEVPKDMKARTMHQLGMFQEATGYKVNNIVSAHLNDVRRNIDWPNLWTAEEHEGAEAFTTGKKLAPVLRDRAYESLEEVAVGDRSHLSPMDKRNDVQKLSAAQKKEYSQAFKQVVSKMPKEAVRRIEANVTAFRWHPDTKAFADVTSSKELRERIKSGETEVGGMFKAKESAGLHSEVPNLITVEIHLDGGHSEEALQRGKDKNLARNLVEGPELIQHLYAHELTHGIDGHNHDISRTEEWQKAFVSELADGKLSQYATTSPSEGFAEFGRMVYASTKSRKWIRENFPKAMKVWEDYKL